MEILIFGWAVILAPDFLIAYGIDRNMKTEIYPTYKTYSLGIFRFFLIYYRRKERKISLVSLIYNILTYFIFAVFTVFYVLSLYIEIFKPITTNTLWSTFVILLSAFPVLFWMVDKHGELKSHK